MALDIVTIAPLQGYKQGGGNPGWLAFCEHRFSRGADGQLEHYTDGQLRARVPPEGWSDYVRLWPEAKALIGQLHKAPAKKARR